MTLYNIRSDGDEFRITKFTNELDVESSYLTSHTECQCPAGSRPTCRHRQMLPTMLAANLLDTGGFYDFESQQVLLPVTDEPNNIEDETVNIDWDTLAEERLGQRPRPSFGEGTVGITPEELAAEIPTYEQAAEIEQEAYDNMLKNDVDVDKPHPTIGKIDRRI